MSIAMKINITRVLKPHSAVNNCPCFSGTCWHHLQCRRLKEMYFASNMGQQALHSRRLSTLVEFQTGISNFI